MRCINLISTSIDKLDQKPPAKILNSCISVHYGGAKNHEMYQKSGKIRPKKLDIFSSYLHKKIILHIWKGLDFPILVFGMSIPVLMYMKLIFVIISSDIATIALQTPTFDLIYQWTLKLDWYVAFLSFCIHANNRFTL